MPLGKERLFQINIWLFAIIVKNIEPNETDAIHSQLAKKIAKITACLRIENNQFVTIRIYDNIIFLQEF